MLLGCTAAAMLPKQARGTFRKHITKPFLQVAAPDCRQSQYSTPLFILLFAMIFCASCFCLLQQYITNEWMNNNVQNIQYVDSAVQGVVECG